jgi:hypothetical protein
MEEKRDLQIGEISASFDFRLKHRGEKVVEPGYYHLAKNDGNPNAKSKTHDKDWHLRSVEKKNILCTCV